MVPRWSVSLPVIALLAIALLATGCEHRVASGPRPSGPPAGGLPASMAALGDSITTGFGSCLFLNSCVRNSWSTGEGLRVDSHLRRIRAGSAKASGHNLAVQGARAADLAAQASTAVRHQVEYVTVLIGANDACRRSVAEMTAPAAFRAQLDTALGTLRQGLPKTRVLVASVPDLYRLWEIGHGNDRAVRMWARGICPSLLGAAASLAPADAQRRAAVRDRIAAYNRELAGACRAYGPRCRYDGGAVHSVRFTMDMLNTLDYFHPDADGQNKLADVTYPGSFTWA